MTKSAQLEYASHRTQGSTCAPISGTIALISGMIQFPWMWYVFMMAFGDVWGLSSGSGSAHRDSPIYLVVAFAPTIVGIACGFYSIRIAGFGGKRNVCGSVGVALLGCLYTCIALCFLVGAAVHWLRANGYFGTPVKGDAFQIKNLLLRRGLAFIIKIT